MASNPHEDWPGQRYDRLFGQLGSQQSRGESSRVVESRKHIQVGPTALQIAREVQPCEPRRPFIIITTYVIVRYRYGIVSSTGGISHRLKVCHHFLFSESK